MLRIMILVLIVISQSLDILFAKHVWLTRETVQGLMVMLNVYLVVIHVFSC